MNFKINLQMLPVYCFILFLTTPAVLNAFDFISLADREKKLIEQGEIME